MICRRDNMISLWTGTALLAGSWLFGLDYFYPANPWAWFAAIIAAVVLFGNSINKPLAASQNRLETIALFLLLPVAWYATWPYRAAPLLIVLGLAIRLLPIHARWTKRLAIGMVAAGLVMFVQGLALLLYADQTACSHELFWPLPEMLAGIATLLGIDATADGSNVVIHSMRQTHRLGATWELLLDPATFLFYVGGVTMLAWRYIVLSLASSARWSSWLHDFRRLTLILLAWLPLRAGLMMAIYLQRVLRSDPDRPLHAMNHFFSPWVLLVLLVPPVLLAWRFVVAKAEEESEIHNLGSEISNPQSPIPNPSLLLPAVLVALSVALLTVAIDWDPVGPRRDGRVMVVERHSTWEPTTTPYDTKSFGELSGYNYAAIYEYLGQYFQMSRLLEKDPIRPETLAQCDVLIIKNPSTRYSPAEVDAVVEFVQQGGGLLLMGDHTNFEGSSTIINDITRPMGFVFRDDLLFGFGESPYDEHYVRPSVPHPIVQHIPPMDFAVSCSIDPGHSRGRAAVASTGLWSMGPEYHHENYHPFPQHCPEMRYGGFVQVWAARYGEGRAVGFTDSTIFSNFCVFQPGKAELMLGMVAWLNHGPSPFNPRLWLLLLGLPPLVIGLWMAMGYLASHKVRGTGDESSTEAEYSSPIGSSIWLLLLAAGACGWVIASIGVAAMHRRAMPTPECVRPMTRVVIDRTTSTVPLSEGADTQGDGEGYGLLEQWIARMGCYTVRKDGPEAFSGDAMVIVCPSRSVTAEFREQLAQYVADGGRLLVIDSPENTGSTANSLLWPFGLSIHHDSAWKGKLSTTASLPIVDITNANEVTGGQPVAKLDRLPVAAVTKFGKGSVMAIGFGSLWNDTGMGEHWMLEPDATVKARYEVLFALLRSFLDGKPLPTPPPAEKPPAELPIMESGPAEM